MIVAVLESGTVIGGRYRLTRQVGEGGMATIWEADHLTLGVRVAVKLMSVVGPHIAELSERFMNEARGAASVRHRNVVEIIDFGLYDGRTPYMVMELLEGESLADRLGREGDIPAREAIFIVSHVLRGLTVVHEAGLVHRDLKPENIFLVSDPEEGVFPKLIDFGVSKGMGRSDLTHEGALVGTPDYMSPEQARGRKGVDLRTDLYSMGVILYELLTGRLPFEADNLGDLIVMICGEEPIPLERLRPDLPPQLSRVVHKAMAKDRELRHPDAREMRDALNKVAESFGFSSSGSQLISLADFPDIDDVVVELPPRARPNRRSSRDDQTDLDVANTLPAQMPPPRPGDRPHQQALGALPALPQEPRSSDAQHSPTRRAVRPLIWALLVFAIAGAGTAAAWRLLPPQSLQAVLGKREEVNLLAPWVPKSTTLPATLQAPTTSATAEITILVRGIPAGAHLRIDGLRVAGSQIALPARERRYRLEVADETGVINFRMDHPGQVDGVYEWAPSSNATSKTTNRKRRRRRGR